MASSRTHGESACDLTPSPTPAVRVAKRRTMRLPSGPSVKTLRSRVQSGFPLRQTTRQAQCSPRRGAAGRRDPSCVRVARSDSPRISSCLGAPMSNSASTHTLFPKVYASLRELAERRLHRDRARQSLSPSDLVHEVYLRLLRDGSGTWESPSH